MSGRHRVPRRRRVENLLIGLWLLVTVRFRVTRRTARRVYGASPAAYQRAGLVMADIIAAAQTTYPIVEPCPWGLSAGACAVWHPSDHVSRYAVSGAGAPVA